MRGWFGCLGFRRLFLCCGCLCSAAKIGIVYDVCSMRMSMRMSPKLSTAKVRGEAQTRGLCGDRLEISACVTTFSPCDSRWDGKSSR
jgi:hypothetical protein